MNNDLDVAVADYPELETPEDAPTEEPDDKPVLSHIADWNIASLRGKHDKGLIILQPEYQREYVWKLKPELPSRLIESVLLHIPIPPLYFGRLPGGKMEVIDGQQRLTTLIEFISNGFPLQRLQRLSSLNGKLFRDLTAEQQETILDATIRTIVIDDQGNYNLRYEVFERLNRGSVALTEQELRNSVYHGSFADLLKDLETDPVWRKVKGGAEPEPRFIEREMILRFFAFADRINEYSGNLKRFLNSYMGENAQGDAKWIGARRSLFRQTMQNVYTVFGDHAGRMFNAGIPGGRWEKKFSVAALDIQASALMGYSTSRIEASAQKIRDAYVMFLMTREDVRDAISRAAGEAGKTKLRWYGFKGEVAALLGAKGASGGSTPVGGPLDDAELLLKAGQIQAAGNRAGVALEQRLEELCAHANPPVQYKQGQGMGPANLALKNAGIYDLAQWKLVEWMAAVRNKCSHPTGTLASREEVVELIEKVRQFLADHPA